MSAEAPPIAIVTGASRGIGAEIAQEAEVVRLFATCDRELGPPAAARLGAPNEYVDYAASKGALDSFAIGLAQEVAQEGIRVNGVRAGFIYTEMHASGGEPARVDRVKAFVPMRRGGQPEEVARAILWLLSDEAGFTTGSFVDVTGGR